MPENFKRRLNRSRKRLGFILNPDKAEIYELLSHVYIRLEQYEKALDVLKTLLRLRPDDVSALYRLSGAHFMLKQNNEGIVALREVIRLRPREAEAYKTLGYQLMSLGRNNEAEEALRQSLALNPEDKDVRGVAASPRSTSGFILSPAFAG